MKSVTTSITISSPERYAFIDLTDDLRRVMQQLAAARPLPPLPAQAPVQEAA